MRKVESLLKRKKLNTAQIEARMEREGQEILPGMPAHSHRGGKRTGAGRKTQAVGGATKQRTLRVSNYEYNEIRKLLRQLRNL